MKKFTMNVVALLCAFFACNVVMAQKVVLQETFENGLGDFTIEGFNGSNNDIWQWNSGMKNAQADAFSKFITSEGPIEVYLVSPEVKLGTSNKFKFDYKVRYFSNVNKDVAFCIREVGATEWTKIAMEFSVEQDFINTGNLEIPETYDGMSVQFGFMYTAYDPEDTGIFDVKNLMVRCISDEEEKANPNISFNVGDVEAIMGQEFEAPAINNPNNVEIVYSSNKPEVATVDATTGAVTLVGEGFTTITATSVENNQYKSVSVNYVLTVLPASAADVVFEQSFETTLGDFVVEGFNGPNDNIWSKSGSCVHADAFGKFGDVEGPLVNYLVSPEITLDAKGNVAEFKYYFSNYDKGTAIDKQIAFCIRTIGGEWEELVMPEYISSNDTECKIEIPAAYAGQKVEIGFKYTSRLNDVSSVWNIYYIVIKKFEAAKEKADPELSFPLNEYIYEFGPTKFEAPVVNNPNNLEVSYSSDNIDVADVEYYSGTVWVYDYGTTVITASSEETDEFKAGSASYTLKVIDEATNIEGVNVENLENGKLYDLQGRRVNKMAKGVYIVNGKKVVIK